MVPAIALIDALGLSIVAGILLPRLTFLGVDLFKWFSIGMRLGWRSDEKDRVRELEEQSNRQRVHPVSAVILVMVCVTISVSLILFGTRLG